MNRSRKTIDINSSKSPKVKELLGLFSEILLEVTTLEVKTVVVEEIPLDSFNSWQVYQELYTISPLSLEEQGIVLPLRDRYLELRRQLDLEYNMLLQDPHSELYQPDLEQSQLPSPLNTANCQILLKNRYFISKIRKLKEIKTILDQDNANFPQQSVYAQTLIELEGSITNRYTQQLLDHPQRDQILALHSQGVSASVKQWRAMIRFLVNLIKSSR